MHLAQFVVAVLMTLLAAPNVFEQNCPVTTVEPADQRAHRDEAVQYLIAIKDKPMSTIRWATLERIEVAGATGAMRRGNHVKYGARGNRIPVSL